MWFFYVLGLILAAAFGYVVAFSQVILCELSNLGKLNRGGGGNAAKDISKKES